jgi:hypothetical protein
MYPSAIPLSLDFFSPSSTPRIHLSQGGVPLFNPDLVEGRRLVSKELSSEVQGQKERN